MRSTLVAALATLLTVAALAQPAPASGVPGPPVTPNDGPLSWSYGPFSYDPAGNITAIGTQSFVYDPMARLVKSSTAQAPGQQVLQPQDYTYDVYGNLTSTTTSGLTTSHAVNAATNRLTSLSYDAAGNVTAWQPEGSPYERNYAYDELNMLAEETVAGNAGEVTLHLYTADDERYWTYSARSAGEESHFKIRDLNGRVLRDFAFDGTTWSVFRDYVYRGGILLASLTPTEAHHVSVDHLGSPRLLTKDNRYRVGTHTYLPFGREWTDGTAQDGDVLKFTGHERDGSLVATESNALDYMHARYYSGNLGRFTSIDPIIDRNTALHNPQAWNRYAYGRNQPLVYIDPDGRLAVPWHFGITYVAARRSGMSFGRSLLLAGRTAWVDLRRGSQSTDAASANMHAMRGFVGTIPQTIAEGRAGTVASIKNSLSTGDVAAALHTVQDAATPLHQDRIWPGYRGLGLRDAIAHIFADLFPSWSTVTTATANSEELLAGAAPETLPLFTSDPLPPPGAYNDQTTRIFGYRLPGEGALIDGVWYFASSIP